LKLIGNKIKFNGDPFDLVESDVKAVKEFAINNVVSMIIFLLQERHNN